MSGSGGPQGPEEPGWAPPAGADPAGQHGQAPAAGEYAPPAGGYGQAPPAGGYAYAPNAGLTAASNFLYAVAAALGALVVKRFTERQEERARGLGWIRA